MHPDDDTAAELRKFNAEKLKWSELKCSEIQNLLTLASQYPFTSTISNFTVLNLSARLLCAGPKFDETQSQRLTFHLQQMQSIFTTTQICLPKHFDICLNLDRIWDFTYVLRDADGRVQHLNLDAVRPKVFVFQCHSQICGRCDHFEINYLYLVIYSVHRTHVSKLRYYDGSIPQNYYINGASIATSPADKDIEAEFRSADVICYGGEEEFELIMRGDFTAFNRSDCALRFNEIFRWAWESWRLAVGNEIGTIYAQAIEIMNSGARENGKL